MIRVKNQKVVKNLSNKSLFANRTRNLIAIVAIALTALLFTALFTIALSINQGFQENNFRQIGGFSHGTMKHLTEQQMKELSKDPLIKEWGVRRFLGMPVEAPFHKAHVEVGYSDANNAHWMYCDPVKGRLPKEGTNEAATDLRVLKLLGVKPEIGAEFTVSFQVDGQTTTQTFILCGWWEYEESSPASHILIPESRVEEVLNELGVVVPGSEGMTGAWNLDVMFSNSWNIEKNMKQVLSDCGYREGNSDNGEKYIQIGVNWGYSSVQLFERMDPSTVAGIAVMLLLIIFTGYLIIYNVFQISVAGDIRFYGLLKTIGTTQGQLRKIIRRQAFLLSLVGIPIGLILGWLIGGKLTPVVIAQLNGISSVVATSPVIFVFAAVFALFTVWVSCFRPARMAAKVSPVEAVRYTEGSVAGKKKHRKFTKVSVFSMAWANLGRSKGKTLVTVVSLSLAVVFLTVTVTFTKGFDMDKYLRRDMACDFQIADSRHFQNASYSAFDESQALPRTVIEDIRSQGGVTEGGKVYGYTMAEEFLTEADYRAGAGKQMPEEMIEGNIEIMERNEEGLLLSEIKLYGMEPFVLDKLRVLEGDLSKVYEPGSRYIAAVYRQDDYGEPEMDSHWAKIGDKVTVRYAEKTEYYNPDTGEVYPENADLNGKVWSSRATKYHDVEYTVAALVCVPLSLTYRHFGEDEFVLNAKNFIQDTGTENILYYAFDTDKKSTGEMESFLENYTKQINPQLDYDSKAINVKEFEGSRDMFLMMGSALSFIVALVGILNFFNAIFTGITVRQREFAMLQSIGMTGKQLKQMLILEGLLYTLGSGILTLVLVLTLGPVVGKAFERVFWFFTYHATITPIVVVIPVFAIIGILVPLVSYHGVAKHTIVERLRVE